MDLTDRYHIPIFSQRHIAQMFAACDLTSAQGQRDYTMLLLLSQTGIRLSELCKLRVQDIQQTSIHIVGKANSGRDLHVSQEVGQQLHAYVIGYRQVVESGGPYVFIDDEGQPLTPDTIGRWFTRFKAQAGIEEKGLSLHAFRNTRIAQLFQSYKSS